MRTFKLPNTFVLLCGILAMIAYPNYTSHLVRSKRTQAASCLQEAAQYMERFYTTNLRYDQTTNGAAVSLPAPLSDINGAIALGVMSYGVILFGGLIAAGVGGFLHALKDFSLPISMSFRLFGALLSGALVTELVYYYAALSYVLPVIVGVMFTLLHALIQAYVLTMLVALYFGEVSEKQEPKKKKVKAEAEN